jgi:hypothetical protein
VINVQNASMAELLAYFNANSGKPPVKRFADRKSAEKRVLALPASAAPSNERTAMNDSGAFRPFTVIGTDQPAADATTSAESAAAPPKKEATMAATKKKTTSKKKANGDRSAAVQATWDDPKVRKARATHHKVKVANTIYRSVIDAFKQLGLPMGRAIGFRLKLKAEGKQTFEHNDKKFNFILVEPDAA